MESAKKTALPQKDALKVKSSTKSKPADSQRTQSSANEPVDQVSTIAGTSQTQAAAPPSSSSPVVNSGALNEDAEDATLVNQNSNRNNEPRNQEDNNSTVARNRGPTHNLQNLGRSSRVQQMPPPENTAQNTPTPVCTFYKQGRCKHGISGKKDGVCNYAHPKKCKKFVTNGNRRQRGCTNGSACQFLHPKVCIGSLRNRLCTKEDCTLLHIKGTKKAAPISGTNNSQQSAPLPTRPENRARNQQRNTTQPQTRDHHEVVTPQTLASFLDQLAAMNTQMQQFNNRLQLLDQRYNTHQLPPPLPTPRQHNVVLHPYLNPYQYQMGMQGQPPLPQVGGMVPPQAC